MRGSHRARGLGAGVFSQSLSYNRCPHEPAGRRWRWFPSWGFVPMTLRSIAALILVILLVWAEPGGCQTAAPAGAAESKHLLEHRQDFEKRLRLLADLLADPCVGPAKPGDDRDSAEHESRLFEDAAALVAEALNQTDLRAPGDRATSVFGRVAQSVERHGQCPVARGEPVSLSDTGTRADVGGADVNPDLRRLQRFSPDPRRCFRHALASDRIG